MNPPSSQTIAGLRVVPRRHYGRWLSVLVLLGIALFLIDAFAHGQIDWNVVGQFMTVPVILKGLLNTITLTIYAMILGIVLGVIFAMMTMSNNPVVGAMARFYIWFFRGTPLLLQLLLWFNLALVFPRLGIPGLFEYRTVDVITPFLASLLGLGIGQGAYTAEVVRGGIMSIDPGQTEAARAIGMTRLTTLRRIVLPQALRVIIPPVGNEIIAMIKLTSVASVIQYDEVLHNAQTIYYANAKVIELLIVATVWYLAVVSVFSVGQHFLEKALARSQGRRTRPAAADATPQEA